MLKKEADILSAQKSGNKNWSLVKIRGIEHVSKSVSKISKSGVLFSIVLTAYAFPALAGGASGGTTTASEIGSGVIRPIGGNNNTRAIYKAIKTAGKYIKMAKGKEDKYHENAAYLWGYEVANTRVITIIRTQVELAQYGYYTFFDTKSYDTSTVGYFVDSVSDVLISRQGAIDAKNGKSPEPPHTITSSW